MRAIAKLNQSTVFAGRTGRRRAHDRAGAVLLEVILALVLFLGAATIIGTALNSSATGVERLRRSVHAADLATSALSELQIGTRSLAMSGPEPFEPPFDTWMCEVLTVPIEQREETKSSSLLQVEVVVRDTESDFVYRLCQTMPLSSMQKGTESGGTQLYGGLAP